jgi:hypothetical protein
MVKGKVYLLVSFFISPLSIPLDQGPLKYRHASTPTPSLIQTKKRKSIRLSLLNNASGILPIKEKRPLSGPGLMPPIVTGEYTIL